MRCSSRGKSEPVGYERVLNGLVAFRYSTPAMNRKRKFPPEVEAALGALMLSIALWVSTVGEAHAAEVHMGLFSVKLPVIAILHDNLFVGEAIGHLDRTGTIDLRSVIDPSVKCVGRFHFTGLKTGVADMKCDDKAEASLLFNALGVFSGYGAGSTPEGPASFTFGLEPVEAAKYLRLPNGKRLVEGPGGLRLDEVQG